MENKIFTQAARFLRERRIGRRWKAVVLCLAIIVVCVTTWILSRESQALTHSEAALACPVVVHTHTADCSDESGNFICGMADYVFHMHNAYCYDADDKLVCQLEEVEPHEHDTDCFTTEKVLICGYEDDANTPPTGMEPSTEEGQTASVNETMETPAGERQTASANELMETSAEERQAASADGERELICGKEEHTHSGNCYEEAKRELSCGQEEREGHEHSDDCYEKITEKKLSCGQEEREGHKHSDGCYEKITEKKLSCGQEEGEEHTHDDGCYTEETKEELVCSQTEGEGGHTHTDGCYTEETTRGELVCSQAEGEGGHTHTDDCYKAVGGTEPVCGREEHKHSDACYSVKETDSRQDETEEDKVREDETQAEQPKEDEDHKHTDDCYQTVRKLSCGKKGVHIHDGGCYENGVLICEVPYVEAVEEHVHDEKCFETDDEEEYTKTFCDEKITVTAVYKKSAKIPEEARLDVEQITKESDGQHYEKRLKALSDTKDALEAEETLAMLLRIGFCTDDEKFTPEDTVRFTVRFLDDSIFAAGDAVKVACFEEDDVRRLITGMGVDDEGAITFEIGAFSELAFIAGGDGDSAHTLTYECEDYIMTVTLGAGTQIPEDAQLTVDRITEQNNPVHYEQRLAQLEEEDIAMLMRIWISADGIDTGLKEKASVRVQFLNDAVYAEGDAVKAACIDGDDVRIISGTNIDDGRSTMFEVESLSELALLAPEEDSARILTYEGEDYIVTVGLGAGTEIPEDAQLMVEQITAESDAEQYKGCLTQLEEAEGMLEEEEGIALLLHMWISANGEEVALDGTAKVKVQFPDNELYFEGDAVKAAHFIGEKEESGVELLSATDIDEENSTTFEVSVLNEFAFIMEDVRVMTYEGEDFIVTVRFHETAQIPENAELIAERITEESDPEHFSERADALQEQAEEGKYVTMNLLMKIGFYVGGKEIEPQDTVDVKIQMLDRGNLDLELEEDNPPKIVHFAEDGMEILEDADVVEDEDNSLTTTFLIDSFSEIAMYSNSDGITTAQQFHVVMEKAKDGDTVVIGANIDFQKPNVSYTRDTRPGDGHVPETDDPFYKGYHVGDTGEVIIAKVQTPGDWHNYGTAAEHKHITLDLNGYTLRLLGDNMTLIDVCWGAELTVKDSWAEKTDAEKAADPRPNVYSISYQITTSNPVDSSSGITRETTETRVASGGAMVGNGYREDFWQDDGVHANVHASGGNCSAVITMWFGKLNFESGIIAENANRAIRCRAGVINLDGGYLLNNAAKEHYPREGENKYTYGTSDPRWYGYYGGALGGAVECEEVPGFHNNWTNATIDPELGVAPRAYGTINLTGTVLSGNRALQGGAIHATGCNINISGGYVTHNRAFFRYWGGGGGGIKVDGPIATQKGVTVGNGMLTMTGGQITANEVAGGGGGICVSRKADVHLEGGFIAGNTTTAGANGEGGGVALYEEWTKIFIDTKFEELNKPEDLPRDEEGNLLFPSGPTEAQGYYVMTPFAPTAYVGDPLHNHQLYITNNHSKSETDWGGGGLFVSEGATAYLYYVLITENSTKGFGGGLAGCATGRILDFTSGEQGAAIFGNSASGDAYAGDDSAKHEDRDYTKKESNPIFWERDTHGRYFFQDYFSALYSRLGNGMIGGGSENWDGSMDGERLSAVTKDAEGKWMASYVAGLTANPSDADKAKAKKYTCAYISGNTSVTHGGGVMCNGIISIGVGDMEITSAMQLKATKAIKNGNQTTTSMLPGQFSFSVYAETAKTASAEEQGKAGGVETKLGNIVSVGTNDTEGHIEFNKLLTFQKTGWVRFILVEDEVSDQPDNIGIATDPVAYIVSVYVQKVLKPDPARWYYDIKQINLERGWIVKLSDGSYFKWATGAEGRWINVDYVNHGYDGDQKYHSEDHPLILDLTKGVMKYEYNDDPTKRYPVVVGYQYAPTHTFTNTKHNTTRLVVEKKWNDDVPVEERKPVLVRLYKKWIEVSTGKLYKDEGLWGAPTLSQDGVVPWAWQWTGLETISSDGKYRFEYYVKEEIVGTQEDNRINDYTVQYEYGYLPDVNGTRVDQVIITNSPKTYGIELTKCDEKGAALSGAQFVISKTKEINEADIQNDPNVFSFVQENDGYVYCGNTRIGGRVSKILATSEDDREDGINAGKISISGLPKGEYYLIEIAAPKGYLPVETHKITLGRTNDMNIECSKQSGCAVKTNGADQDVLYIKLTDEAEKYSLPETGGLGTNYKNILGVVTMSGMIALIYMTFRRRKEEAGR